MKYIWPMLGTAMRERQETCNWIACFRRGRPKVSQCRDERRGRACDSKGGSSIIEQARGRANQMIEEAEYEARQRASAYWMAKAKSIKR